MTCQYVKNIQIAVVLKHMGVHSMDRMAGDSKLCCDELVLVHLSITTTSSRQQHEEQHQRCKEHQSVVPPSSFRLRGST